MCLRGQERFVQEPAPRALQRIPYTTEDGWQCFLFRCPPPPGAPGEPVVLAHGQGLNRLSLDYTDEGLIALFHAWGFDVYLLEHRADASVFPPRRPASFDADTIAAQDVPAAIQAILDFTGHRQVGWVGHGFGGQLLYIHLAQDPYAPVFAAPCLGSPAHVLSSYPIQSVRNPPGHHGPCQPWLRSLRGGGRGTRVPRPSGTGLVGATTPRANSRGAGRQGWAERSSERDGRKKL
jgi:pimeloyl-ACP methyl ester carboxylesterase